MKQDRKNMFLWITIAFLAMALIATYFILTFRIQDTEKRLFEALHQQKLQIETLRQ